jgi:adenylosuccinate lyase
MVMERLGLAPPDICWATARDRSAEFASLVAMCAGTLGKIANEIYTLQRTEVGELEEPRGTAVGSSTMPQKRNPRNCETSMELVTRIKYFAMMQMDGMMVEHERGMAGWYIQRDTLDDMCLLMGDLLSRMKAVVKGLVVHPERMRQNLEITRGLILSEPLMFEIGKFAGKQTAHELVFDAAMTAFEQNRTLKEVLLEDQRVSSRISSEDFDRMLDPAKHVGLAPEIALKMVNLTRSEREKDYA